jgi:hypothetical protein
MVGVFLFGRTLRNSSGRVFRYIFYCVALHKRMPLQPLTRERADGSELWAMGFFIHVSFLPRCLYKQFDYL